MQRGATSQPAVTNDADSATLYRPTKAKPKE
jgi:hypothetical protein